MSPILINNVVDTSLDVYKSIYDIKGAAFESFNFYKEYVDEITYEIGMMMELQKKNYTVFRQQEFYVHYKGINTGVTRRMDMLVETPQGTFLIELKALNAVDLKQRRQLWSYMKLVHCQYGMLLNFSPQGVYSEIWKMDLQDFTFNRL